MVFGKEQRDRVYATFCAYENIVEISLRSIISPATHVLNLNTQDKRLLLFLPKQKFCFVRCFLLVFFVSNKHIEITHLIWVAMHTEFLIYRLIFSTILTCATWSCQDMLGSTVSPTSWSIKASKMDLSSIFFVWAKPAWAKAPWWTRCSTPTSKPLPALIPCRQWSWRHKLTSCKKATFVWSWLFAILSATATKSTRTIHSKLSSIISTHSSRLFFKKNWRSNVRCLLIMTAASTSACTSSAQLVMAWSLWIWFAWRNWTQKSTSFPSLPKLTRSPKRNCRNLR